MLPSQDEPVKNETESSVGGVSQYDVIIVGGGAAGVGVAIALTHAGVENFLLVDRNEIGSSFASWPDETRFITPSFPSNSIGMLDLNSIAVGVSPAFSMRVEHPTGSEFAKHLQDLSTFFELPIQENTDVVNIEKKDGLFHLVTDDETLLATNVIWAAGEYQYPGAGRFTGSEFCRHTSTIPNYEGLEGDEFQIIGGYESGFDAAYHLAKRGKKVKLFDKDSPWSETSSDPSVSLSTFSFERMRDQRFEENVELFPETLISSVSLTDGIYEITTQDGQTFQSKEQPLLASGFEGSHKFVSHLFEMREDGFPVLTDNDESTTVPGMFLSGPAVRHGSLIFCFIFKYRQRFGIVAQAIASSLDIPTEEFIDAYRSWGMYLDDLSCCGQECLTC
ncbi:MAG: NAD(P)/FAD-dependent oxidoreductase [Candidatus Thalassarchaeaceae archaeon]|nr:MAG: monooxygenase [Euryarchaeota archaeon]RPG76674.1 MAG: monooxygenase [Euryarchaeota archaeon TMED85]|tara:strand:+ start:4548 stop:5720 length:1173 start_codon:yes stop_codon:yes gene_type:complete